MRLGKVKFRCEYVVDLDDLDMVSHAEEAIVEDVLNAVKFNEVNNWICLEKDKTAKQEDIPDFLKEQEKDLGY